MSALEESLELPKELRVNPETIKIEPLNFDPPSPRIETFENGLKVYLLEDHTVPLVQFRAIARFGSMDDPDGKEGLAQITMEALRIGGAGKQNSDEMDDFLESIAARIDTRAAEEHADLFLETRTVDHQRGLAVLVDLLRRPRFEQKAVSHVLDQMREAISRRENDTGSTALRGVEKALWGPGHPYSREPTLETVGRVSRADVAHIYAANFVPNQLRIIVTGDFDSESLLKQLGSYTKDWKRGVSATRRASAKAAARARRILIIPSENSHASIRIGQLAFARHDPREHASGLLDMVLGGGQGASRLYNEIRDRLGLAYSVDSEISSGAAGGMLLIAIETRPESAREVIARTLSVVEGIRGANPISDSDLESAKDSFVNGFVFHFDSAAQAAYERALYDFYEYPSEYFKNLRPRIQAITTQEVNSVARELIDPSSLQIIVVANPARLGDLSSLGKVEMVEGVDQILKR